MKYTVTGLTLKVEGTGIEITFDTTKKLNEFLLEALKGQGLAY